MKSFIKTLTLGALCLASLQAQGRDYVVIYHHPQQEALAKTAATLFSKHSRVPELFVQTRVAQHCPHRSQALMVFCLDRQDHLRLSSVKYFEFEKMFEEFRRGKI